MEGSTIWIFHLSVTKMAGIYIIIHHFLNQDYAEKDEEDEIKIYGAFKAYSYQKKNMT
jgi:hypothetical protein